MKPRDYKYERLSEESVCDALANGIVKLAPRQMVYHAANYILTYNDAQLGQGDTNISLVLEDKKKTFHCLISIKTSVLYTSTEIKITNVINPDSPPNYTKAKSGLRQMLAAIVLFDYADIQSQEAFSF